MLRVAVLALRDGVELEKLKERDSVVSLKT
jgi:hypothetical protein